MSKMPPFFSPSYRYLNIILACVQNMTLGGLLFGWASISGTLLVSKKDEGGPGLSSDYVHMMFVVASFFNFLGPMILGIVLDMYGPRRCSLLSICFVAAGCALFSFSDKDYLPMFVPGMCLIAFGGPGAQSSIIHLSNLFPRWKATATAFITGSFQLSFIVFLVFDQLWLFANWSYNSLFLGYCIICAGNALVSLVLWPDEPYRYEDQLIDQQGSQVDLTEEAELAHSRLGPIRLPSVFVHKNGHRLISNMPPPQTSTARPFAHNSMATIEEEPFQNTLKDSPLQAQVSSAEFVQLALFFVIHSFWGNFYIGTFDLQLGDSQVLSMEGRNNYARIFTMVITLGVVVIPAIGALMDIKGFPVTSAVSVTCGVLWAVTLLVGSPSALLASFAFYSAYRTSFFTFFFAYLADVLGFKYFGMLAGIIFLLGGVAAVLQYPLARYATGTCHSYQSMDHANCTHGHWFAVNVVMLIMLLASYYFCYSDWQRRKAAEAADQYRQQLLMQELSQMPYPTHQLGAQKNSQTAAGYARVELTHATRPQPQPQSYGSLR